MSLCALALCLGSSAQNPAAGNQPSNQQVPPTQAPALGALNSLQGLPVRSIQFRGVRDDRRDRFLSHVEQKEGQPLERTRVRESIRNLYRTGLFDNIEVDGEPSGDLGVNLIFVVSFNHFVGTVTFDGIPKHGPSENQLVNATNLQLGELFTHEKVVSAFARVTKVMQDSGFYEAQVSADEVLHPETQQMDVAFHLVAGPQASVGNVTIADGKLFTDEQLRKITKLDRGDRVGTQTVTTALQRLRKYFQKQKRLEAQVAVTLRRYRRDTNTVDYTFSIQPGPTVDIHLEGAHLSRGTLKRYVPVYEESAVDEDLLNEGKRNLRDYFQTLGYFDVTVDVDRRPDPAENHLHVIYDVNRGLRHKLEAVLIDGNKYFDSGTIRERMTLQPASFILSHGRFSQSLLAADVASITALYLNNGFSKVQVTSSIDDNYQNDPEKLAVAIHISEGPQSRVRKLQIVGNSSFSDDQLREMLSTIEGQPFATTNVASDRDVLVTYYYNRGFPDVQFEANYQPTKEDPTLVDVTYSLQEGRRVFVDKVVVRGLENTRPHIVSRDLAVKQGDALSQSAMLESQRRLYDLGIFNEVDMAVQNPEGEAAHKSVVYDLKEAKRYTFNYGFGIEIATGANVGQGTSVQGKTGVSPRVSFDVTRINFRGRDQSIIFKSRIGRLQRRGLISFDSPRFFDLPKWKWTVSGFYDNTRDVRTFASERLEFATQLEQKVRKDFTVLYRFSYRRVKVDPNSFAEGFNPQDIAIFSRPVRVGMPNLTFLRDRRDDPIDATKGSYTIVDLGTAWAGFGSEANFNRLFVQNATYYTIKKKYVLARSTRIGFLTPFGTNLQCATSQATCVPLPERFFEGGGNSQRGFAINQAGPRDLATGSPLGGNATFINNLELRLPPVMLPFVQQNLGFVIFHDMGNVFSEPRDVFKNFFRFSQKDRETCKLFNDPNAGCDFNYMSHAIGGGIRYKTPIGPIRVDLGYNLNPPVFPIKGGTTPSTVVPHFETLRRLNIFFSIGQTF